MIHKPSSPTIDKQKIITPGCVCHHLTPTTLPSSTAVNSATTQDPTIHAAAAPSYKGALKRLQMKPPHLMANSFLGAAAQVPTGARKAKAGIVTPEFTTTLCWSHNPEFITAKAQTKPVSATLLCHQEQQFPSCLY